MIRVLGGRKQLCDGLTRRDLLQVGSLGMLGAGLGLGGSAGKLLASEAGSTSSLPGFGQAKSCILLFMYGSPSQIETFDPKPDAPAAIRGEFGHIPSGLTATKRTRPMESMPLPTWSPVAAPPSISSSALRTQRPKARYPCSGSSRASPTT